MEEYFLESSVYLQKLKGTRRNLLSSPQITLHRGFKAQLQAAGVRATIDGPARKTGGARLICLRITNTNVISATQILTRTFILCKRSMAPVCSDELFRHVNLHGT